MSERNTWRLVRDRLAPFGRLTRIENRCDRGTPDTVYTLRYGAAAAARTGWIEFKTLDHWPARPETAVRIEHLTLEQVTFLEEETRAGGRAWLLVQVEDEYLLLGSVAARAIYDGKMTRDKMMVAARVHGVGFPVRRMLAELTR